MLLPGPTSLRRYENASSPGRKGAHVIGAVMSMPAGRKVVAPAGPPFFGAEAATAPHVGPGWSSERISTFATKVFPTGTATRAETLAPCGSQAEAWHHTVSIAVVHSSRHL